LGQVKTTVYVYTAHHDGMPDVSLEMDFFCCRRLYCFTQFCHPRLLASFQIVRFYESSDLMKIICLNYIVDVKDLKLIWTVQFEPKCLQILTWKTILKTWPESFKKTTAVLQGSKRMLNRLNPPEQRSGLYAVAIIWRFRVRDPLGSDTPGVALVVWP
jgi:hypothetical protein